MMLIVGLHVHPSIWMPVFQNSCNQYELRGSLNFEMLSPKFRSLQSAADDECPSPPNSAEADL